MEASSGSARSDTEEWYIITQFRLAQTFSLCRLKQSCGHGQGVKKEFWAVEEYEFWDDWRQRWTKEQPSACLVKGLKAPQK